MSWEFVNNTAILRFQAMASPCEVLFHGQDVAQVRAVGAAIQAEALRIESTYSRYRPDSLLSRINASAGKSMEVDAETAQLLDYAATCHGLSAGRFDITSGILRRAWRFDGNEAQLPDPELLATLRQHIGWQRVHWQRPHLRLQPGMELDLGGIGKEYAVDRCLALARAAGCRHVLVNFGGDLAVSGPRADGRPWQVGCWDDVAPASTGQRAVWEISAGAVATSGSSQRFLLHDGRRYGHILDPTTGAPVPDAPLSVSVAADSCSEAGTLSTLAMLHGDQADAFLRQQGVAWRVLRENGETSSALERDHASG